MSANMFMKTERERGREGGTERERDVIWGVYIGLSKDSEASKPFKPFCNGHHTAFASELLENLEKMLLLWQCPYSQMFRNHF